MLQMTEVVKSFPSARIPAVHGGVDVEISLIAQLGHGAGNHLFFSISQRQAQHSDFIDELDEPSAKIGNTNFAKGDATALYSFTVGPKGHPFHRHAGHRIFTAISGSGGAQLRFSTATTEQIAQKPQSFVEQLQFINIPPDCLFTVRFGGETWHQFYPLAPDTTHPVFFALSCHTNELGGNLSEELREKVIANTADIPALTHLLPPAAAAMLEDADVIRKVPVTTLALDAPAGTLHRAACDITRGTLGTLRGRWAVWKDASGYRSKAEKVELLRNPPPASLLHQQLGDKTAHYEDTFVLRIESAKLQETGAVSLLAQVLEGFLNNRPRGVSRLMKLRNTLVKPLGLRTSPLGCPVSTLLAKDSNQYFAGKYPVIEQNISPDGREAQVILGADDKHLSFRSCIGVRLGDDGSIDISLGDRIYCKNLFGHFYMSIVNPVHRTYIAPTMLRMAVQHALKLED